MIKSIFYSEFHPVAGPKIVYQVPEDYISKEEFDAVSIYIITKQELKNRIITVNVSKHIIVGCPVCIQNTKYKRNALQFNLCLVFQKDFVTWTYESVVKKLASYLTQLELENEFLFSEEKKKEIPTLLKNLKDRLNSYGYCNLAMGDSCIIHLKVAQCTSEPPFIEDHAVPVLVQNKDITEYTWDLTTQQILHYVDGFSHVAKIAAEADIEVNRVKACLQNLIHYQVIQGISIFQYSNVYTVTPELQQLANDPDLQAECIFFIARKEHRPPNFRDIFQMYCNLTAGTTVKDLCSRYNPHSLQIDERKLIQYGLMKGYIRRLHKYPIKLPTSVIEPVSKDIPYHLCDGCHSFDEICCKISISNEALDEKIESDPSIVICWK
ncbi:GATOR complex protein NPRL2 isoform X1 [Patella vulgata]|uniref:GATOR complex protein NPRL2 isoform X1 n=2 Tax=Patella vulgata TaxID=6465 RepID=UPI00217F54A8|nr:GATOR complex protein NPRL2 isoform X1 [Patella vulgata]